MQRKEYSNLNTTSADIRALRERAIERGVDVNLIAACDAVLSWGSFDPHGYLISASEMTFRSFIEAECVCYEALNEGV